MLMVSSAHAALFSLSSPVFNQGEALDVLYTCQGKDISPALEWEHAPAKTVSFALIVADPDAKGATFYHWGIFNISAKIKSLPEHVNPLPQGAKLVKNSFGKSEYNGPCPPQGRTHHYIFSLYALDTLLTLADDADVSALLAAIQNHVLGEAELVGVYKRIM